MEGDPSLGQLVRYVFGLRLPDAQREWVFHDLNDAGWRWRALWRSLAQAAIPSLVFVLLPGPAALGLLAAALLLVTVAFLAAAYAEDLRDRRLRQHGLPVPWRQPPPRGY